MNTRLISNKNNCWLLIFKLLNARTGLVSEIQHRQSHFSRAMNITMQKRKEQSIEHFSSHTVLWTKKQHYYYFLSGWRSSERQLKTQTLHWLLVLNIGQAPEPLDLTSQCQTLTGIVPLSQFLAIIQILRFFIIKTIPPKILVMYKPHVMVLYVTAWLIINHFSYLKCLTFSGSRFSNK